MERISALPKEKTISSPRSTLSPRRRAYDLVMRSLLWLCAGVTCALLLFLLCYIFTGAFPTSPWNC